MPNADLLIDVFEELNEFIHDLNEKVLSKWAK